LVSNQILNNVNLIQTNRLTPFVWNRIENEGRKQRYKVKKEEEEKYIESILTCKNKKLIEKLNQEPRKKTLSLFEKIMIITLIPFNHFPTVRGFLISYENQGRRIHTAGRVQLSRNR
jgi:hypothetical protein